MNILRFSGMSLEVYEMVNNSNLQTAKNTKDDEFYTTYETIEKEISHYTKHFKDKITE